MKRVLVGLGVALSVVLSLVGCGGTPATVGVDGAFASRVLAICATTEASKQAWAPFPAGSFDPTKPDPAKLASVGAWLESEVAPTFVAWRDQVVAAGSPASGQAAWDPVVTGLEGTVSLNAEQIAAAKAGDTDAFASATRRLQADHAAFVAATRAAGVAACGDIVSS